jgi:radical SAM/Cys-rich protein
MNGFLECVYNSGCDKVVACDVETMQINLGYLCNQACAHCHLNASPDRKEVMTWKTMRAALDAAAKLSCRRIDITGGAPELNPDFQRFIRASAEADFEVQVRTNLAVLTDPENTGLPELFRDLQVSLVGSMPCYLEENVRAQRGPEVYEKSIEAIRQLNTLGYGISPALPLNLVYNPGGAFLPPDQLALEQDYRREFNEKWGIRFTNLLTITNMPIGRFKEKLAAQGAESDYMMLLRDAFNPKALDNLMCRHQISVGWDGTVYDCDFNLALHMPLKNASRPHVLDLDFSNLIQREVVTGDHCLGCTAGFGSSCSGALV